VSEPRGNRPWGNSALLTAGAARLSRATKPEKRRGTRTRPLFNYDVLARLWSDSLRHPAEDSIRWVFDPQILRKSLKELAVAAGFGDDVQGYVYSGSQGALRDPGLRSEIPSG
jgi:hypothetical protein